MRKLYLTTFILLITLFSIKAQKTYNQSNEQVNAGIGISGSGFPIYAGVDFNLRKNITLGLQCTLRTFNEDWSGNSYTHTIIGISGNCNYHFADRLQLPKEFDAYGGLNTGYFIWIAPSGYHGGDKSGFGIGGQLGARYYFTHSFALNCELQGGIGFYGLLVGITIKL